MFAAEGLTNRRAVVFRLKSLFFFSSRRRHTRLTCDWSSDVCSSDLCRLDAGRAHAGLRGPRSEGGAPHAAVPDLRRRRARHRGIGQRGSSIEGGRACPDRKSTRLNSSHMSISYAVFCLKKKQFHTTT